MFTGTTSHSGALISAIAVLTGAAILRGAAAAADSNQDDQFLALLDKEGIPAVQGVPSLIEEAHRVCRTLDAGTPADALVDAMVNNASGIDPTAGQYAPDRLARTEARFIIAAVGAYCPYDQGKIASTTAKLAHPVAAHTHNAVNSGRDLIRPVPSGETTPNPEIPPPPPPAQILKPPLPIAPPAPPKRPLPPPQQPPPPQQAEPPPQQAEPPAVGPQPGGGAGSGGGGSAGGGVNGGGGGGGTGGGGPAEPAPRDPTPGFVRLAP
jgi:hypothetical protein